MPIPLMHNPVAETCRGKSGKSRAHRHYEGAFTLNTRDGAMVTRCSSCGMVCAWRDAHGDPSPEGYQPVRPEDLPALGLAIIANLR